MNRLDRIKGCLLGGAAGDALGAPVEFLDWATIEQKFGSSGIRDFAQAYGVTGAITDDTQMMLFTAEGLLRAHVRQASRGLCHPPSVIHHALLRWCLTQGGEPATEVAKDGWLIQERALWSRRAPGMTCLSALRECKSFGELASNDSKGCGGVMRVAPHAFFPEPFVLATESARLTHGHPTGYLAAGIFADILSRLLLSSCSLKEAMLGSLQQHGSREGMSETRELIELVLVFHEKHIRPSPKVIALLGGGWTADEALAIGLWCALMADSFEQGVSWAVNHSGDSDSTGMIAGHLLGIQLGCAGIPERWLASLELREVIEQVAEDIDEVPRIYGGEYGDDRALDKQIFQRYPGW
ncbi:ADP-ribosylglycohydrolase family protein [Pseudomonas aeruginosa]|uniref:ADP-ribosylglycohydrolase family protein n=1 Tax=Pseudomonas aeruginosa TaxID=287 RepID=UPI0009370B37|nr:ADP-ribosylglycohydrolase family protein [Pseudomonas aeruginosa]ASD19956.1 crystallin J1 [Pseudomonas aeruginosa]MBG4300901.1 ADP-ribosylglycohydrolase family protein [Pseudomonas aeruginosa]MBH8256441.1 ADP-ribosylglycohydrolase family protein [Pseudomonas aeruginosa]MBH8759738.1 ADP-ribosylglycohydrolase family protein [Pseudomonas aeruginosa]MBX5851626.1 ADP-ribosylglycohydrolase family protein [Pseudomonas aeruginosa]